MYVIFQMEEKHASPFSNNTTEQFIKQQRNPFLRQVISMFKRIFVVASTCNTAHMSNNKVT